jgi:S1-C subfamily serine protease/predicted esterase
MMRSAMLMRLVLALGCLLQAASGTVSAGEDVDAALEQATKAALDRIAPVVVQIRTVGGLEVVGGVRKGLGPTTGVIVDPDGYIISSSFNFASKPSAIAVSLPGRQEPLNAQVVAQDQTRMLTLLKVEANNLPTPAFVPKSEIRLGQWALAVGRTWADVSAGPPSVSVGIISAKDRIWGKALQTDAKVSPVNYGGPLIDLEGRVLGILVPLSPQRDDETAGVEWYDGGIGFAIPMEDILAVLPRLKQGTNLTRGLLGIRMKSRDQFSAPPVIGEVGPGTAAAKAGLLPGDLIVEVDGKPVSRYAQIQHILGVKYAGDRVSLKVKRGDQVLDFPNIELTGPVEAVAVAFLGILPMRDDPEAGVAVRYLFPNGPARQAGIRTGDRIVRLNDQPILNRLHLSQVVARLAPQSEVTLDVKRKDADKTDKIKVRLAELSSELPEDELPEGTLKQALAPQQPLVLPGGGPGGQPRPGPMPQPRPMGQPPRPGPGRNEQPQPKPDAPKGVIQHTDPATGHAYWLYVPENYDPNISHGLVIWLHPAGDTMEQAMLRLWQDLCKKHHLILYGPKAENPTGWLTSEADLIREDLRKIAAEYTLDRSRIVTHGLGQGASFALYLAFDARDQVRGAAVFGGALPNLPRDLSGPPLSFFLVGGGRDPEIEAFRAVKPALEERKFPVHYRELPEHGNGYVTDPGVLRTLISWIEGLDRI